MGTGVHLGQMSSEKQVCLKITPTVRMHTCGKAEVLRGYTAAGAVVSAAASQREG